MISFAHVICFLVALHLVNATIEVFDRFGRKVDTFQDREAAFDDDFVTMEGYVVSADPPDGCKTIAPPTFLTNFTMGKFVLINGTSECGLTTKVRNAEKAGYDVAVIYDPSPMPFEYIHIVPFPKLELSIEVLFVSYEDGIILKSNYVYNNSYEYNYRVKIKPNTPDFTYYMYLFGAVIGVCFFVMLLFMICLLIKCIRERQRSRRNRLSSRQIKEIPTKRFSKGDQYDVCAICLEDFKEGDKLRILPCSHAYHSKCIDPWLKNNRRNCPLCKRKVTFGDSDNSDSDDSELVNPAEHRPLLLSRADYVSQGRNWGTFFPASTSNQGDGSGPSSLPGTSRQSNAASSPESDSEDSERLHRALHQFLFLRSADLINQIQTMGLFGTASTSNQGEGNGPSSLPGTSQQFNAASSPESDTSSENHFLSADESESLLPPSHHSVNNPVPLAESSDQRVVILNLASNDAEDDQRGLIV